MRYTEWPVADRRKFTREELAYVTLCTQDRINELVSDIKPDTWQRAHGWYSKAHLIAQELSTLFGCTLSQSAGVIAALSPRVTWETNLDEAREVFTQGEEWGYAALPANVDKALDIIAGSEPDDRLGGRKVRSFYRNIIDPWGSLDVTLDGWMVTALDLPGNNPHKYLERRGVYDAIADGFRTEAEQRGIMPHVLQAAIWIQYREVRPREKGMTS